MEAMGWSLGRKRDWMGSSFRDGSHRIVIRIHETSPIMQGSHVPNKNSNCFLKVSAFIQSTRQEKCLSSTFRHIYSTRSTL